jgi:hypothetical protein
MEGGHQLPLRVEWQLRQTGKNGIEPFPADEYRQGRATAVYEFFAQQPKDIAIASPKSALQFAGWSGLRLGRRDIGET